MRRKSLASGAKQWGVIMSLINNLVLMQDVVVVGQHRIPIRRSLINDRRHGSTATMYEPLNFQSEAEYD